MNLAGAIITLTKLLICITLIYSIYAPKQFGHAAHQIFDQISAGWNQPLEETAK
jgi:hypothetical protein